MSIVTPSAAEVLALQAILGETLYLRLYSNNVTPDENTTAGSLTEVVGGGYAARELDPAGWGYTAGDPSVALYSIVQEFEFTGVTDSPSTVYGYYVTDALGNLRWVERFAESVVPYTPVAAGKIQITVRYEAS